MTGIDAANAIQREHPTPIIFVTANASAFDRHHAGLAAEAGLVEKPFSEPVLQFAVLAVLGDRLNAADDLATLADRLALPLS